MDFDFLNCDLCFSWTAHDENHICGKSLEVTSGINLLNEEIVQQFLCKSLFLNCRECVHVLKNTGFLNGLWFFKGRNIWKGQAKSCTKTSDCTAAISASHAHRLICFEMIYTNMYTIIQSKEYTSCHYPETEKGYYSFQMLQQWCFEPFKKRKK